MATTDEINLRLCASETKEERAKDDFEQLTRFENLVKGSCIVAHFIINYNLFEIYKGNYKHASKSKYRHYLCSELRMARTNIDEWYRRLGLYCKALYVPFVIRMTMLCVVQLAKYQATSYKLAEQVDANLEESGATLKQSVEVETALIKFLKQTKLYYWFGNALSEFPGIMLTIYIALFIAVSYSTYIPFYHYKINPPDAIDIRVGLNPKQERKRIDLVLCEKMKALLLSNLNRASQVEPHKQFKPYLSLALSCYQCTHQSHQLQHQPEAEVCARFIFDPALRSSRYSAQRPRMLWSKGGRVVAGCTLLALWLAHVLQSNVIYWSITIKCQTRRLPANRCNIMNALTLDEIYSIFELLTVMYAVGFTVLIAAIDMAFLSWCQQIAINETKSDLKDLLNALRLLNQLRVDRRSLLADAETMRSAQRKERYLSDALLKMLVKTSVFQEEFVSQADYISERVSSLIVLFGTTLVLALTLVKMDGPDLEELRTYMIRFMWIGANFWFVLSASQFANIVKLQKVAWSILAQLYAWKQFNKPNPTGTNSDLEELAFNAWRKFVQENHLTDTLCSVRPFGVSLTFKRMLAMNFYVSSLAALVFR